MIKTDHIETIQHLLDEMLNDQSGCFLVSLGIHPGNNIKIALDAETGVSIEKCVKYHRALYKKIEEAGLYPEANFALEVSSPGLDEPLKTHRQYLKNKGRLVEIILNEGQKLEGKMLEVSDNEIVIEETVGKKKETIRHSVLIENIKSTKIQIVF
jgi:ribosome maturation factor RimP